MKAKIKISRTVLLAINTFRSTDDARPAIAGICIEVTKSGKCRAIATDGKRLGAIENGEALELPEKLESVTFILNEPLLKALPKSKGIGDDVIINVDGARIEFSAYGTSDKTKFEVEASEHMAANSTRPATNFRKVCALASWDTALKTPPNWRLRKRLTPTAKAMRWASFQYCTRGALMPMVMLLIQLGTGGRATALACPISESRSRPST